MLKGYLGIDRRINLKWILKLWDMKTRTKFIWHRTGTSGGLL
jgi:hypothetical protein